MDKDTKEHKLKFLATEVMGWMVSTGLFHQGDSYIYAKVSSELISKASFALPVSNWQPFDNIEQAYMLLDKFADTLMGSYKGNYVVSIFLGGVIFHKESSARQEAICEAVLQASGYYE